MFIIPFISWKYSLCVVKYLSRNMLIFQEKYIPNGAYRERPLRVATHSAHLQCEISRITINSTRRRARRLSPDDI